MSATCSVHGKLRTLANLESDNHGGYRCKTDSFCQSGGSISSRKRPHSIGLESEASSSKRSNTPCKFFLRNACEKGESCPFLHDSAGSNGSPVGSKGAWSASGKGAGMDAKGGYDDSGYGWDDGMPIKGGYGKMDMMGKGKTAGKGGGMKGSCGKMGDDWMMKGGWDSWEGAGWDGADWGKGKGSWEGADWGWGKGKGAADGMDAMWGTGKGMDDMGKMGAKGKGSMMGKGPAWQDWDYGDSWSMPWSPACWKGGWGSDDAWAAPAWSKGSKGMPGKDGGMEIDGKSVCSIHQKHRLPEFLVKDPRTGCFVCAPGYECKAATPGTLCKFYAEGKCQRGLACEFSHGEDSVQIQTTAKGKAICQVHGKARKPEYLTTDRESGLVCCLPGKECKDVTPGVMCKFFQMGKCDRGDECAFSHGQAEQMEEQEALSEAAMA